MSQLGGVGYSRIELWDTAGAVKEDQFVFTTREEDDIRVTYVRELDTADKLMDNGDVKRYYRGMRIGIELDFSFDDWVTTTSSGSRSCQEFLVDLHNHTGKVKVCPHTDESMSYWVLLESQFNFPYAFGKWVGWRGTLKFKGSKILSSIDIAP